MNTDTVPTVPEIILQQLSGGRSGRLVAMIGAHSFNAGDRTLTFKYKARARNGSNCCRIRLDATDTYEVEFLSVRSGQVRPKSQHDGIYADMLTGLFERETGLYLRL